MRWAKNQIALARLSQVSVTRSGASSSFYHLLCEEIKESTWGRKLIVQQCIDELLNLPKPKLNFFYSEDDGTYKINGTKTGYPFKPWLEQLEFKYMGGDKNTRHFANKYLKAEDKEHCRQQLAALCEKFGWQLVAY